MKLKTFSGKTMAEALEQVKRCFGRDAVILNTRTLSRGGLLGLRRSPYVEITAARALSDLPQALRRNGAVRKSAGPDRSAAQSAADDAGAGVGDRFPDALLAEMGSIKTMVTDLVRESRKPRAGQVPDALFDTYQELVANQVADQLATELIEVLRRELPSDKLRDPLTVRARLAALIQPMVPVSGPISLVRSGGPTIVALIGPTGVGKTTTAAKLAANFCLRERRRVGLITIDTYRIAAVEQLRTYAQIIDVPLQVATSPEHLKESVRAMSDRDVILIDTAGRSQRDELKIKELQAFFQAVRPHETHLVLSGTCGEPVLHQTIERFRGVGIDRVIFTKLDEAVGFGVVLSSLKKANAKLSYVTTGQDVPEDIAIGQPKVLADLIVRGRPAAPVR